MNNVRFSMLILAFGISCSCSHNLFGMKGVSFVRSTLIECDIIQSDLTNANFSHATLTKVNFPCSNLTNVNFSHAHLAKVNFDEAILTGADFSEANLVDTDLLEAADLHGVNLYGVKELSKKQLMQALARGAILRLPKNVGSEAIAQIVKNLLESTNN
jgi:uncharacterized protein YjbI with pentapeptide repeats